MSKTPIFSILTGKFCIILIIISRIFDRGGAIILLLCFFRKKLMNIGNTFFLQRIMRGCLVYHKSKSTIKIL